MRTPPWYRDDAEIVLATSLQYGLEGVVGKPLASRYHPGGRRDWIKVKNIRHQEVIIGGWNHGEGGRANTIGSLLLGVYDNDRLRYAGNVGTGFTQATLTDLLQQLGPLERDTSPFGTPVPPRYARGAHWVEPRLAGEVAFTEWTADGSMRHPSWRGLRAGKNPGAVHREALTSRLPVTRAPGAVPGAGYRARRRHGVYPAPMARPDRGGRGGTPAAASTSHSSASNEY